MLITRETDYALRILRSLSEGESITVGEMAVREEMPQNFAYKIAKKLEKAGFLSISRGIGGGCSLACDLRKVTLFDLITAVENRARLSSCMLPGYDCEWRRSNGCCRVHIQLCRVQETIDKELASHTLHWVLNGEDESKENPGRENETYGSGRRPHTMKADENSENTGQENETKM